MTTVTQSLTLTQPSSDELWQLAHATWPVTMSPTLRNEIAAGLPQPRTHPPVVPPVIPPVIPPATTGPSFPTAVPGYNRVLSRVWDQQDFGWDLAGLTADDLVIVAYKMPSYGAGELSVTAFPAQRADGTPIPQQQRTTWIANTGGGAPCAPGAEWSRTGQDAGIQFQAAPGIPGVTAGLTPGAWYYFHIKSIAASGSPCDMRLHGSGAR